MPYDGQFYLGANASSTPITYLKFDQPYTISFTVDTTTYPNLSYPNHWFVLSTNDGTGYVNICGNGSLNQNTYRYNGGNSSGRSGDRYGGKYHYYLHLLFHIFKHFSNPSC